MNGKHYVARGYYKTMACITALINVVGLVFYIILMVNVFSKGTDYLTTAFLILGLIAMVTILPTLANFFMGRGVGCDSYHLYGHDE